MADGEKQVADHASYALSHMTRLSKSIDNEKAAIVFSDMTPEQLATSCIESFGSGTMGV